MYIYLISIKIALVKIMYVYGVEYNLFRKGNNCFLDAEQK